jgi:glycosyltransferase involved in cell wall biosynthesis
MTARVRDDISLIMTVFNEGAGIKPFLQTLERQTVLPARIVVVDGGSSDDTVGILGRWDAPEGVEKIVVSVPGANTPTGRNAAVDHVETPWLAVADGGTELNDVWLESLAARIAPGVDVVSGWFEPLPGTLMSSTIGAVITPTLDEIDPETFMPSCRSVAFRTEAWREVGGQPVWLDRCQDLYMDLVMKRQGYTFVFAPEAIAAWDARPTLKALYRQYKGYSRGDGKADLWRRRHAVRYGAYVGGAALVVGIVTSWGPLRPVALALSGLLGVGAVAYMRKFWRRVWLRRGKVIRNPLLALLLAPIVVVTGDLGKMVAYPGGRAWRKQHRNEVP